MAEHRDAFETHAPGEAGPALGVDADVNDLRLLFDSDLRFLEQFADGGVALIRLFVTPLGGSLDVPMTI